MKKLRWYHTVGIGLIIVLNVIIGFKSYKIGSDEGREFGTDFAQLMFLELLEHHEGWDDAVNVRFVEALMRKVE